MIPSPTEHQARQQIKDLVDQYRGMTEDRRTGITEAGVVNQFLAPFFAALGWPVTDPDRYKYELYTYAGRPDVTLILEKGDPLFVEAKRFGVIKHLDERNAAGLITDSAVDSLPISGYTGVDDCLGTGWSCGGRDGMGCCPDDLWRGRAGGQSRCRL
jgi:hypothetical protein